MKILGVSGSLRSGSYNTGLLRTAARLFTGDVEFEIWDRLKEVPPYDEDDDTDTPPEAVAAFRDALAGADGVFFATPEYNSSIPGQLKNAIDWASRPLATNPLRNKPVAIVGASTGAFGAVWSQADLRKVLAATGARVVEGEVAVGHAPARFGEDGLLADDDLLEQLQEVVAGLVEAVEARTKGPGAPVARINSTAAGESPAAARRAVDSRSAGRAPAGPARRARP